MVEGLDLWKIYSRCTPAHSIELQFVVHTKCRRSTCAGHAASAWEHRCRNRGALGAVPPQYFRLLIQILYLCPPNVRPEDFSFLLLNSRRKGFCWCPPNLNHVPTHIWGVWYPFFTCPELYACIHYYSSSISMCAH